MAKRREQTAMDESGTTSRLTRERAELAQQLKGLAEEVAHLVSRYDAELLDEREHEVVLDALGRAELALMGCKWLLSQGEEGTDLAALH